MEKVRSQFEDEEIGNFRPRSAISDLRSRPLLSIKIRPCTPQVQVPEVLGIFAPFKCKVPLLHLQRDISRHGGTGTGTGDR